jgi:hypothetical protein
MYPWSVLGGAVMGVMLALDQRQARARRRAQHRRTPEEQACLDAFAAFLRYDAPGAGRCLSRLATTVLAGKLLPAAKALADAVDIVLGEETLLASSGYAQSDALSAGRERVAAGMVQANRNVTLNFTVSPACLLGMCRSGESGCSSPLCEHDCHCRQHAAAGRAGRPAPDPDPSAA